MRTRYKTGAWMLLCGALLGAAMVATPSCATQRDIDNARSAAVAKQEAMPPGPAADAEKARIAAIDIKAAAPPAPPQASAAEQAAEAIGNHFFPGLGSAIVAAIPLLRLNARNKQIADEYKGKASAAVRVVDAFENLKSLDPSFKAIIAANADKLANWMGEEGQRFVDAVQKAGNDPMAKPVI